MDKKSFRSLYRKKEWLVFYERIIARDKVCQKCHRGNNETTLQVHHTEYKPDLKPWDYPLSYCITLCKGCHAREHGLIEPSSGWELLEIRDLGDITGLCEREGCGQAIRYEQIIYHPQWGYKTVGSTCVEYLTDEDKMIISELFKLLKKIRKWLGSSDWEEGWTKNNKKYIYAKYRHNHIRIYSREKQIAYQLAFKREGVKNFFDYSEIKWIKGSNLDKVKEIAFIIMLYKSEKDKNKKNILSNIYNSSILN